MRLTQTKFFLLCIVLVWTAGGGACRPDPSLPDDDRDSSVSDADESNVVDGAELDSGQGDENEDEAPTPTTTDYDEDGFSEAEGDCNDYEALINPMAFEVADNERDDDCNGEVDEEWGTCDCDGGPDLPAGLEICDERFLLSWERIYEVDSGERAGAVRELYGGPSSDLTPRQGCAFTILSTGFVDIDDCPPFDPFDWFADQGCMDGKRQPGVDLVHFDDWLGSCDNSSADPAPDESDGAKICDVQQLVLNLQAPSNANGFSFDFIYMSTEYPEYVDEGYNDAFYAILERSSGERQNISFDEAGHEIEIDNAFFENPPSTDITDSGYDGICDGIFGFESAICGSSTGWLRTSWNIEPGESFTLTFSIHDEGDGVYDSAVVIDNFAWSPEPVEEGTDILY